VAEQFATEFPGAGHIALGFDGVDGKVSDLAGFTERGLRVEASTVMSATSVHEPPRPNRDAVYRALESDDDWAQSVELRVLCNDEHDDESFREFATRKVATQRQLTEAGHGGWFGAFVEGRLVAQMGLFAASPGLARFQSVETDPEFRGRGLAGTLVHHVSRYGFDQLRATTLVMVADPDYLAIRVYRSVGFTDGESQLQAERPPRRLTNLTS
jgi:ribosomal protein S18 acetylase RimI-like enzyme